MKPLVILSAAVEGKRSVGSVVGIVGQTVKLATRKIGSAQGWLLLGLVSVSTTPTRAKRFTARHNACWCVYLPGIWVVRGGQAAPLGLIRGGAGSRGSCGRVLESA